MKLGRYSLFGYDFIAYNIKNICQLVNPVAFCHVKRIDAETPKDKLRFPTGQANSA
jgi:hypothetical protein